MSKPILSKSAVDADRHAWEEIKRFARERDREEHALRVFQIVVLVILLAVIGLGIWRLA